MIVFLKKHCTVRKYDRLCLILASACFCVAHRHYYSQNNIMYTNHSTKIKSKRFSFFSPNSTHTGRGQSPCNTLACMPIVHAAVRDILRPPPHVPVQSSSLTLPRIGDPISVGGPSTHTHERHSHETRSGRTHYSRSPTGFAYQGGRAGGVPCQSEAHAPRSGGQHQGLQACE